MAYVLTARPGISPVSIVDHLLKRIEAAEVEHAPFCHMYVENVFPEDVYAEMIGNLPDPQLYQPLSSKHHQRADGVCTRAHLPLNDSGLSQLSEDQQQLWSGVLQAMTSPQLKTAVFRKLSADLAYRFGIRRELAGDLEAFARPALYRDLEGYEIPPHPDTRKKIVTMQFYLPADHRQWPFGTSLYERHFHRWSGLVSWKGRFRKVKQFPFIPNSGYAFVVNNTFSKKSWHGRERLPAGCGVRHSLLNAFYCSNGEVTGDYDN